jgi:hypothetical protein
MLNSNLLELLSKFTPVEIKELGEFVSSPFFNKNENVIKLFNYVKKYFPEFDSRKLEKEYAFSRIFGKEKYNDGYMRTLMFRLQKQAEEYLSYINYKKKEGTLKINLLEELNQRKLEKAFLKTLSEQEKEFEESGYKGYNYYHYKSQLENLKLEYYNWRRYKSKDFKDYTDESIFSSVGYINRAYLIRILSKYIFVIAKSQFHKIDYDFKFLDFIVDYLEKEDAELKDNPVIKLQLYEILLLKNNDHRYYDALKEMLVNEKTRLSQDERYSLHNILNQYLVERIYQGHDEFKRERFELYKIAIAENIYKGSSDIYFDDIMFGGIILVALLNNEYDWAEEFIEKFRNELSPDNRATVINFSLAKVSFAKKDFAMALKHLSKITSIKNIQYKTAVRDLSLMTYYELSMFSQAYFLADSYRHFLGKNKTFYSPARFERMSNYLKLFVKLVKLKECMNKNDFEELKMDFEKEFNIMERDWLFEKINELEK